MPTKVLGGAYFTYDTWQGYPHEREELLAHISAKQIKDVVFVTGDIHTFIAGDVRTGDGRRARRSRTEFVGGSITSQSLGETDLDAGGGTIIKGNDANPNDRPGPHRRAARHQPVGRQRRLRPPRLRPSSRPRRTACAATSSGWRRSRSARARGSPRSPTACSAASRRSRARTARPSARPAPRGARPPRAAGPGRPGPARPPAGRASRAIFTPWRATLRACWAATSAVLGSKRSRRRARQLLERRVALGDRAGSARGRGSSPSQKRPCTWSSGVMRSRQRADRPGGSSRGGSRGDLCGEDELAARELAEPAVLREAEPGRRPRPRATSSPSIVATST